MPNQWGWKLNAPAAAKPAQYTAYISLGSNIEPERNLPRALALLQERSEVEAVSSAWRSAAVGSPSPEFLNAAVRLRTPLKEAALKQLLRSIESDLGRVRGPDPNAPRPIDLDILLFDGILREEGIWRSAHLALPMSELLPELADPQGQALKDCAARLQSNTDIKQVEGIWPE